MRRWLWGLGVIAVLAGASLVLPPVASAVTCPSITTLSGRTGVLVAEGINFQTAPEGTPPGAPGHFACTTPATGQVLPSTSWNLFEDPAFHVLSDTVVTLPHSINMLSEAERGTLRTPIAGANNGQEQPGSVLSGMRAGGYSMLLRTG